MNYTALARPYANAVFETAKAAKDSQSIASWQKFLGILSGLTQDSEISDLLDHPQVSKQLIEQAFLISFEDLSRKINQEQQNFMKILIQNSQLVLSSEILKLLNQNIADQEARVQAEIQSPFEIDQKTLEAIKIILTQKFKKNFDLNFSLCPDLIGGIKIKTDHWVIDDSIQARLKELQRQLKVNP